MDQEPEKKSRKRLSPAERMSLPSLEMRVSSRAKELEDRAWQMPPGPVRDQLLRRARQMNVASHVNEWLSSRGLHPPK
jgi:hypothetical protein